MERAARAALGRKATDVVILDLRGVSVFTDFFLLASGTNQKQLVAITDAIQEALRAERRRPGHVEGYPRQEWILHGLRLLRGPRLHPPHPQLL